MEFLIPVDANMQALNIALQVYIINNVYPRLSLEKDVKSRYDVTKGELYVYEEKDMAPVAEATKETAKAPEKPEAPTENKTVVNDAVAEPKK